MKRERLHVSQINNNNNNNFSSLFHCLVLVNPRTNGCKQIANDMQRSGAEVDVCFLWKYTPVNPKSYLD